MKHISTKQVMLLLFALPAIAFGQATLTGVVKESSTKDPLIGVNVVVQGTSLGATTDINGVYKIVGIPEKVMTVRASSIGYEAVTKQCDFSKSTSVELNLQLAPTILQGEVVLVTAQMRGQSAAINQQLTAEAMINAVSAEKIQQLPDVNAAEAIGRLPGISVTRSGGEGNGVSIRGLSPKYSKITINGVTLPATGDVNRSTDLSMIAPENLGGIEVFKAITPDMDADAIGGTVNLVLSKAHAEPELTVQANGAYNVQENDAKQYKADGKWSERLFDDALGVQVSFNGERMNRSADRLQASYVLDNQNLNPDGSMPIVISYAKINDRVEIRKRWGGSAILDVDVDGTQLLFANFYNYANRSIADRFHDYNNSLLKTHTSTSLYELNTGILSNSLQLNRPVFGGDASATIARTSSKTQMPYSYGMTFDENDPSFLSHNRAATPMVLLSSLVIDSLAILTDAGASNRTTTEVSWTGNGDWKFPFQALDNVSGFVKIGGKYRTTTRKNDRAEGHWAAYLNKIFTAKEFLDHSYDPGKVLNGTTTLGMVLDPSLATGFHDTYFSRYSTDVFWGSNDRYETTENTSSGYAMVKLNVGQMLTVIPGVRMESVNNSYKGYIRVNTGAWPDHAGLYYDTTSTQVYQDWFPMVHKVSPLDWFDIRAAFTKTLSRPDFWDLTPFLSTGNSGAVDVQEGNPDLRPARSTNYDISASFFSSSLGLLSIGAFHKDIKDVTVQIKRYMLTQAMLDQYRIPATISGTTITGFLGSRSVIVPINTPKSTIDGIDVDLQTNLSIATFLPEFLRGVVVSVNYTHMKSETLLPYFSAVSTVVGTGRAAHVVTTYLDSLRSGPVPYQSNELLNLSVGYDLGGFSGRVSLHNQSPSLLSAGTQQELDTYADAFSRWDISIRQQLTSSISLYFNGVNITNNPDGGYVAGVGKTAVKEYYGSSYDLGFKYTF